MIIICVLVGSLIDANIQKRNHEAVTQNLLAAETELVAIKRENATLLYERNSYILENDELKEKLNISKRDIDALETQLKSKISYISKLQSLVRIDTVIVENVVEVKDSTTHIRFNYKDDWMNINGESFINFDKTSKTIFNNISVLAPLTIGLTDDYKIFATSENPYISFTSIEGSVIENSILTQKKTGWEFGVTFGAGLQYGLIYKNFDIGPNIGIGAVYHF